jgi:O-acetyl-ADP-ribose deacetylase (regulator of RNase III)
MGSGIAKLLRATYPEVYDVDTEASKRGENTLGNVSFTETSDGKFLIINLYGQNLYGTDSRKTNYEAFYKGLEKVKVIAEELGNLTIGIPYLMGCDRAGGNWNICEKMIDEVFKDYKGDVLICELEQPSSLDLDNPEIVTAKTLELLKKRHETLITDMNDFIQQRDLSEIEVRMLTELLERESDDK